jgi:hypothetical protein
MLKMSQYELIKTAYRVYGKSIRQIASDLPLGLAQAAAYIESRSKSYGDYLDLYESKRKQGTVVCCVHCICTQRASRNGFSATMASSYGTLFPNLLRMSALVWTEYLDGTFSQQKLFLSAAFVSGDGNSNHGSHFVDNLLEDR